jgi:hypothetical protein
VKLSKLTLFQLKRMLITANHILHYHGIVDAYGHISIRHPQNPKIYVMSGYMAPALVTSSDDLIEYWVKDSEPVSDNTIDSHLIQLIANQIFRLTKQGQRKGTLNDLFMERCFECIQA